MVQYVQHFAAVCGNYHIISDTLDEQQQPGTGEIPKLCPQCSAPVWTTCRNCNAPILGYRRLVGVAIVRHPAAPWFCHECSQPYLWATPDQIRQWVENRLKFDEGLDEDAQFELLETLAMLTPGEPDAPPMDFSGFRETLKKLPDIYEDVKPFLPMLRDLFT